MPEVTIHLRDDGEGNVEMGVEFEPQVERDSDPSAAQAIGMGAIMHIMDVLGDVREVRFQDGDPS